MPLLQIQYLFYGINHYQELYKLFKLTTCMNYLLPNNLSFLLLLVNEKDPTLKSYYIIH